MIRYVVNIIGKYLFPFNNARVVCPPGAVPVAQGRPIVVASLMRSGTHLAIDLLLNNFPTLAGKPLYVDADQFFRSEDNRKKYLQGKRLIGQCVIKTHYPQSIPENKQAVLEKLVKESHVILLHRPIEQTYKSLSAWGMAEDKQSYHETVERFYDFWRRSAPQRIEVHFEELIHKEKFSLLIRKIEEKTGLLARRRVKYPVNPKKIWTLIITKTATRVFGKYARTINTGIRSGMSGN